MRCGNLSRYYMPLLFSLAERELSWPETHQCAIMGAADSEREGALFGPPLPPNKDVAAGRAESVALRSQRLAQRKFNITSTPIQTLNALKSSAKWATSITNLNCRWQTLSVLKTNYMSYSTRRRRCLKPSSIHVSRILAHLCPQA